MPILETLTPAENEASQVRVSLLDPITRGPTATVDSYRAATMRDQWSAFSSQFARDNEVITAINSLNDWSLAATGDGAEARMAQLEGRPSPVPADWNPYRHILDNWDETRRTRARVWISEGLFNDASSPRQLERMERQLTQWETDEQAAARAPTAAFVGSLVGGVLSPTTLIGGGWAMRSRGLLSSVSRVALANAAGSAAQEGALQYMQPLRDIRESVMNVGVAGVLGGGVGALAHALSPRSALHPSRVDNPLRTENYERSLGEARVPGETASDPIPNGLTGGGIGADVAEGVERSVWHGPAPDRIGGTTAATLTDWFTRRTPAGRALSYASDTARRALGGLMEISAYSRTDLDGVGRRASAEALRDDMLTEWQRVRSHSDGLATQLDQQLAQLGAPKVATEDLQDVIRRSVVSLPEGPDTFAPLVQRYGADGAERIKQTGAQIAEQVHKLNEVFEGRLRQAGAIRDDARVTALSSAIERMRADRDTRLKDVDRRVSEIDQRLKDTKSLDEADRPEARLTIQRERQAVLQEKEDIRRESGVQIERVQGDHARETAKPEALGRDYGMAQLWSRRQIVTRKDEFKDFLTRVIAKNVDADWLRVEHGMTRSELDQLAIEDPAKHQTILNQYGLDGHDFRLRALERQVDALREADKGARLDLGDALRRAGYADELVDRSERSVGRWATKQEEAAVATARANRDAIQRTRQAVDAAIGEASSPEVARGFRQDIAGQVPDAADFIRLDHALSRVDEAHATARDRIDTAASNVEGARTKLAQLQDALDRTPREDHANGKALARQADRAHRALKAAEKDHAAINAQLVATDGRLNAVAGRAADLIEDAPLSRVERVKRLTESRADLDKARVDAEARLRAAEDRAATIREALDRSSATRDQTKAAAEALAGTRNRKDVVAGMTGDALAGTERRLKSALKRDGISDVVDNIVNSIAENRLLRDNGLDESLVGETGRFKERRIELTPEEREEAMRLGFLRNDVFNVLELQYRQLAGHLGLRQAMGIGEGPHAQFKTFRDIQRAVETDYEELAKGRTPKEAAQYQAQLNEVLKDMNGAKDRLLGRTNAGLEDQEWFHWGASKMRQYNFIRFGPGMLPSSLMDAGVFALRHSLAKDVIPHMKDIVRTIRDSGLNPDVHNAVNAAEPAIFGLNRFDHVDAKDVMDGMGIGASGSTLHTITSRIDQAGQWATVQAGKFSGLGMWGKFWKTAAGLAMQRKLSDMVRGYDGLGRFEKADLASIGIGQAEASRIRSLLEEHGKVDAEGRFDPGIYDWHKSDGGIDGERDWRLAIQRDMRRAGITPGVGDTPLLMDKTLGKLLMQFQTFAFATVNRYIVPLAQRTGYMGGLSDPSVYASLSTMFIATAASLAIKDAAAGKDPMKRWQTDELVGTTREIIDRSGMVGWATPYINALTKTVGLGSSSRFQQNEAWQSILGVNFGMVGQGAQLAASIATDGVERGEWNRVRDRVVQLAPFVFWSRIASTLLQHANQ